MLWGTRPGGSTEGEPEPLSVVLPVSGAQAGTAGMTEAATEAHTLAPRRFEDLLAQPTLARLDRRSSRGSAREEASR